MCALSLAAGTRLGPYNIQFPIGAGGMGEVYRALDTQLGRDVALKVLPSEFVHDPDRLARFRREAQLLASLNHPNIATIHGLEESGGSYCLVMELVQGQTLTERLRSGALPVEEALRICSEIAGALAAAHQKGITHRDIKPANIKVTPEGRVKVLDFGLAKMAAESQADEGDTDAATVIAITEAGLILGTPAYMSPELLRAEGIEPHEIGAVILSHGHQDHVGGSLREDGRPAFPNARYVMLRKEWDYWMSGPTLAELPVDEAFKQQMLASAQRNLQGVQGQIDLVHPDAEIVPGITAIAAFGHSPGQMALDISSSGENLLFVADAVVHPLHLEYPETISVVDHRPTEMVATRFRLLDKAARARPLVSTSHFAFPGLGRVAAKGKTWEWQPIPVTSDSQS